jgi:hypothetical protein
MLDKVLETTWGVKGVHELWSYHLEGSGKHWWEVLPSSVAGSLAVAALAAEAATSPLPRRSPSSTSRAAISAGKLRPYAQEVGFDLAAFDRCLSRGIYQTAVQQDVDEGICVA